MNIDFSKLTNINADAIVGKTIKYFFTDTIPCREHDYALLIFTDDTFILFESSAGYEESTLYEVDIENRWNAEDWQKIQEDINKNQS